MLAGIRLARGENPNAFAFHVFARDNWRFQAEGGHTADEGIGKYYRNVFLTDLSW